MHEGEWSSRLGIPGQPAEAEELMVMRDLALARLTGTRVHFQHLSTAGSIAMVRAAKAGGLPVTCEATTHHFTLTHAECASYDPVFKVNPPLRTDADVAAVQGRAWPTAPSTASPPTTRPHTQEAKEAAFDQAPPGMLGLRDGAGPRPHRARPPDRRGARAAVVAAGRASSASTTSTACPVGRGQPGQPHRRSTRRATWVVDPAALASRSRNTPYAGRTLTGQVRHTLLFGEPVVIDGEAQR